MYVIYIHYDTNRYGPKKTGYTIVTCYESCKSSGFAYFGLEIGNECWCGSSYAQAVSLGGATNCNAQQTGGSWAISVYKIKNWPIKYLGCFTDTKNWSLR